MLDPVRAEPAADLAGASARLEWQPLLFSASPERRVLLDLRARWPLQQRRINVHRNHAVEQTLSAARPYLEYAGIEPAWALGDYDDSLGFLGVSPADVEVVWLDFARLGGRMDPLEIARWLADRLAVLRSRSGAPILVLDWDGDRDSAAEFGQALESGIAPLAGVHVADRRRLFESLGEQALDEERAAVTGTRVSARASVPTARLLGSSWIPALLAPRLKVVVVDLDNTLFDGVLGEDGVDALRLTEAHRRLQLELLAMRESGLLLALLSRNEPEDVQALFAARADFPLRWEHFDRHAIGWQEKSVGLGRIAAELRVGSDSLLFVDDNAGELIEALQHVPGVRCLHASGDPDTTVRALVHHPGVFSFRRSHEDVVRAQDLRANADRALALAAAGEDLGAYHRELGVRLTVSYDRPELLPRAAELCSKTNQFNLALRRLSEVKLRELLVSVEHQIATVGLEDRLSDSGVIAVAVAQRREQTLEVLELCISCRALGRRLEDLIVARLLVGPLFVGVERVEFPFLDGPRNAPARRWLAAFAGSPLPAAPEPRLVAVPAERILAAADSQNVTIEMA